MTAAGRGDSSSLSRIRRLAGPGLSPPSARLVASPRHVVDEPEPLAGLRAGPSLCSDLAKIWIFGDFRSSLSRRHDDAHSTGGVVAQRVRTSRAGWEVDYLALVKYPLALCVRSVGVPRKTRRSSSHRW